MLFTVLTLSQKPKGVVIVVFVVVVFVVVVVVVCVVKM